jgi:CDP-glucose 4,6-dehydratase
MLNSDFYKNKKIFITGHTGFKGCWLTLFLQNMGAEVTGYALEAPDLSLFQLLGMKNKMNSVISDVRDYNSLEEALVKNNPEIIFHLAAQPLVRESYQDPKYTYETNVLGTVNLLEIAKSIKSVKAVVNITTDKCYENRESDQPHTEEDKLGGHDPYSASKACSEIITNSYKNSFYKEKNIGIASARAGNVIGGGDFAKDRIIPDILMSIKNANHLLLRNPNAIRPWQHVFDVLHGYLILGEKLYNNPNDFSEAFNFSPIDNKEVIVKEIAEEFISIIGSGKFKIEQSKFDPHETQILKLDSNKAIQNLDWRPKYNIKESIYHTATWYKNYLNESNISVLCKKSLIDFMAL